MTVGAGVHTHTHTHDHGDGHTHGEERRPGTEAMPGPSQGPVVLDIGGTVGAAVVITAPELEGSEIEIRPRGADWDGTHVAVRARPSAIVPLYAAVFAHLDQGSYELRQRPYPPGGPVHRLDIAGGRLSELIWDVATPGAPGPSHRRPTRSGGIR